MAHTDVHRPHRVLMLDPTIRHWFLDEHDHRQGTCDLDEMLRNGWTRRRHCWRRVGAQAPNLCPCAMCHGWMTWAKKKERRAWRTRRAALVQYRDVTALQDVTEPAWAPMSHGREVVYPHPRRLGYTLP